MRSRLTPAQRTVVISRLRAIECIAVIVPSRTASGSINATSAGVRSAA